MKPDYHQYWQPTVFIIGLIFSTLSGNSSAATSDNSNIRLLAGGCNICHGPDGISSGPAIPSIAGLSGEYLRSTLEGFKSGEIPSTSMGRIVKAYNSDELQALAAHYSGRPFINARQPYNPKQAKRGEKLHEQYCEKCHARGGQSVDDDAGRLAGQWRPYLIWALKDFRSGQRIAGKKMQQRLDKLYIRKGKAGFSALLHYYASQKQ